MVPEAVPRKTCSELTVFAHTNATLHDSLGTPLGTVLALLGHSSSEISRQVCLHSLPEDRQVAAAKLEALLFGPKLDPNSNGRNMRSPDLLVQKKLLVGAIGFEPTTPCAQGRCATRLRYAPTVTIIDETAR